MWKVIWVVMAFVGKPCSMLNQDAYYSIQVQSEQPVCVVGSLERKTLMRDFDTEKAAQDFIAAAPKGIKFQLLPPADGKRNVRDMKRRERLDRAKKKRSEHKAKRDRRRSKRPGKRAAPATPEAPAPDPDTGE